MPRRKASRRSRSAAAPKNQATPAAPDRIHAFADEVGRRQEQRGTEPPEKARPWVTFRVADRLFALPVADVQEVLPPGGITPVPGAPFPVRGITNLRGRAVPVVDMGLRLGFEATQPRSQSRIVVTASRGRLIGLLVDDVHDVEALLPSRTGSPPTRLRAAQRDCVTGVYRLQGRRLYLLDLAALLAPSQAAPPTSPRSRRSRRGSGKKTKREAGRGRPRGEV